MQARYLLFEGKKIITMVKILSEAVLDRIINSVIKESFSNKSLKLINSCVDTYSFEKISKEILKLSKRFEIINQLNILSQEDIERVHVVLNECRKICYTINKYLYDSDSMKIKPLVVKLVKNLKLFTDTYWFKYNRDNEEMSRFLLQGRIVYQRAYSFYQNLK
jgi:hypothetical protein